MSNTLFVDLRDANNAEKRRIQGRMEELQAAQEQRPLTPDENKELALLLILNDQPLVDPLFLAIQYLFKNNLNIDIPAHDGGVFNVAAGAAAPAPAASPPAATKPHAVRADPAPTAPPRLPA